jgi:hypothetical protein
MAMLPHRPLCYVDRMHKRRPKSRFALRCLHLASIIVGGLILATMILVWLASYGHFLDVAYRANDHIFSVGVCHGRFEASIYRSEVQLPQWEAAYFVIDQQGKENVNALPRFVLDIRDPDEILRLKFAFPCWFLAAMCAFMEGFLIRGRWQFSVRIVLLVMTIVAVTLGMMLHNATFMH